MTGTCYNVLFVPAALLLYMQRTFFGRSRCIALEMSGCSGSMKSHPISKSKPGWMFLIFSAELHPLLGSAELYINRILPGSGLNVFFQFLVKIFNRHKCFGGKPTGWPVGISEFYFSKACCLSSEISSPSFMPQDNL